MPAGNVPLIAFGLGDKVRKSTGVDGDESWR
jgi:hypothetical protein